MCYKSMTLASQLYFLYEESCARIYIAFKSLLSSSVYRENSILFLSLAKVTKFLFVNNKSSG